MSRDADRFRWWFSDEDKAGFLMTYMEGMQKRWTLDQWRSAIDYYRRNPRPAVVTAQTVGAVGGR